MENEGVNNQVNTNTIPIAAEPQNNPTPPPDHKKSKLSDILDKLGKSPLFIGNRKFITIPALILALAAIIIVPIIILNSNAPMTEEQISEWYFDTATRIKEIAASRGVDEALAEIDQRISQYTGNNDQIRDLYAIKRSILGSNGRIEAAIEPGNSLVLHYRQARTQAPRHVIPAVSYPVFQRALYT